MKTKILFAGAILVAVALSVNVSLSHNSQTGNVSLTQLSATNEANAECMMRGSFASGKCTWSGRCIPSTDLNLDCVYDN